MNCKYVVEKLRVGVRLNGFRRCDVEEGLRKIMCESDAGNEEMSRRLDRLCEMSMGKVANLKRMANLNSFVDLIMNKC